MVTVIKKGTPLKKITEKLQKLSDKKRAGFNAKKYLGRIKIKMQMVNCYPVRGNTSCARSR